MKHYRLVSLLLLCALPSQAFAQRYEPMSQQPAVAPMAPQGAEGMGQSVEEPDSPDDDDGMGAPEAPAQAPAPIPSKSEAGRPTAVPAAPEAKPQAPEGDAGYEQVVLQGLNKVTARAETIEAPIGSVERFGTIEIVAHSCWKSAPDESPENAALLEISEIKQGEAPRRIFLGWMFSSSPGLSGLEHPFYDITVVKCEKATDETKDTKPEAPPAKPAAPRKPSAKDRP